MLIDEKTQDIREEANKLYNELRLSLLREGKAIYLTAFGSSMYPFVKSGDKIKIGQIRGEEIRIGDIAVVDRKAEGEPRFLVHRVVKITEDAGIRVYFTKGDAHKDTGLEGPIAIDSIVGRVTQIKRKGLDIDFQTLLWRYLNSSIGRLSFRHPKIIPSFSRYINIILERRLLLSKVKNRLKKGNPILYNTEEFILICARKDPSDELIKKAEGLIREGLGWERFCHLAIKNQTAVLIYNFLKGISLTTCIPQDIFDKLKVAYFYVLGRAARQHQELTNLLKLLSGKDIAAVPLKGTFLSKRIYGYIESRGASVDIDIFVKWDDRKRIHEVLVENGYMFLPSEEIDQWLWQESCISPKSQNIDVLYDIWLRGTYKAAIAGLWDGARRVTDGNGLIYYEFEQEEMLIYMSQCLITSDNGYKCLKYACDINDFLNLHSRDLDWESVISKAKKWRLCSSLYTALSLVSDLFNDNLLPSVINSLRPGLFKRLFIKTFFNRRVMLRENLRRKLMDRFLSYIFFDLIEAKHAKEYWQIVKRVLFPPRDVLLSNKNYSSKPVFVGYTLRLFRGIFNLLSIMK